MPSGKDDLNKNTSGDPVRESAPSTSDDAFPKNRGPGEFGTHGGSGRRQDRSPKQPGTNPKSEE